MTQPLRPALLAALPALLFLVSGVGPAGATATLTCDADDRQVEFSLQGNVGSEIPVLQVTSGSITIKKTRERAEIKAATETPQLVQQWVFEKELRIGIQATAPNDVSLYLAIVAQRTRSGDVGDRYAGRYVLKVSGPKETFELKGRINDCEAG